MPLAPAGSPASRSSSGIQQTDWFTANVPLNSTRMVAPCSGRAAVNWNECFTDDHDLLLSGVCRTRRMVSGGAADRATPQDPARSRVRGNEGSPAARSAAKASSTIREPCRDVDHLADLDHCNGLSGEC